LNPNYTGLIELILVFGAVIGFGVWQLWSLKRETKKDAGKKDGEG
jgi:hypothetical protein